MWKCAFQILQAWTKLTLYLAAKGMVRMPGVSITEIRDQQDSYLNTPDHEEFLCPTIVYILGKIIFTPFANTDPNQLSSIHAVRLYFYWWPIAILTLSPAWWDRTSILLLFDLRFAWIGPIMITAGIKVYRDESILKSSFSECILRAF